MEEGQGFVKRVTLNNLEEFSLLLSKDESKTTEDNSESVLEKPSEESNEELLGILKKFSGRKIKFKKFERTSHFKVSKSERTGSLQIDTDKDYELVWRKINLPQSDVQRQPGNPTGGIRLTQARFKVNDSTIDQTRYFRYDLFGDEEWRTGRAKLPNRDTTIVEMELEILGQNYGVKNFMLSHKPSGEAGQGNYTTMLHWGNLGDTIKDLNLVGKTLELYKSIDDSISYKMVITD
jgi:hypothetical protein